MAVAAFLDKFSLLAYLSGSCMLSIHQATNGMHTTKEGLRHMNKRFTKLAVSLVASAGLIGAAGGPPRPSRRPSPPRAGSRGGPKSRAPRRGRGGGLTPPRRR